MRCLHSPFMSSQKPAFQQRNDSIGQWQKVLSYGRILADHIMNISESIQAAVFTQLSGRTALPGITISFIASPKLFAEASGMRRR